MKYETVDVSGLVDSFVLDFLEIIRVNVQALLRAQLNGAASRAGRKKTKRKGVVARVEAPPAKKAGKKGAVRGRAVPVAKGKRGRKAKGKGRKKPEQLSLFG